MAWEYKPETIFSTSNDTQPKTKLHDARKKIRVLKKGKC